MARTRRRCSRRRDERGCVRQQEAPGLGVWSIHAREAVRLSAFFVTYIDEAAEQVTVPLVTVLRARRWHTCVSERSVERQRITSGERVLLSVAQRRW